MLFLLAFLGLTFRFSIAHPASTALTRQHAAAVLSDGDADTEAGLPGGPAKAIASTPDGQVLEAPLQHLSLPLRPILLKLSTRIPVVYTMHLLYTQYTSSAT